jgi:hypothetical protein
MGSAGSERRMAGNNFISVDGCQVREEVVEL